MPTRSHPPDLDYEPRARREPGVVVVPRALMVFHDTILEFRWLPSLVYGLIVMAFGGLFRLIGITFVRAADPPRRWRPPR